MVLFEVTLLVRAVDENCTYREYKLWKRQWTFTQKNERESAVKKPYFRPTEGVAM